MKIVVLHNVDGCTLTDSNRIYLEEARVKCAVTNKSDNAVIFLMWDDRKWDARASCFDEQLLPSPIHRVCDFIKDVIDVDSEAEHVCHCIKQMRACETIHYDVKEYLFIA